jgi:multidrug efflux pump
VDPSFAIVLGLAFATVLTLVVTPAALTAIATLAAWRAAQGASGRAQRHPAGSAPADNSASGSSGLRWS